MNGTSSPHTFHIPVMGTGFSVDTPAKVAQYGISSVISIVDDMLIEKMRERYCRECEVPFVPITEEEDDFRARRITSYLDLIDQTVKTRFERLKRSFHEKGEEFQKYIDMLPDLSELKRKFTDFIHNNTIREDLEKWAHEHLHPGSIDVNIMTKLDKQMYRDKQPLPVEHNAAHSALRGFAESVLESSLVLSAGMNPRLYSYIARFDGFFPNENGVLKKKITIKVSDYRSARIQGQFLAKKGLWVSEYRIESGLNCGGHAFATDGLLMGPILEEFKNNRGQLIQSTHETLAEALQRQGRPVPKRPLPLKITAQGGVGTAEEHQFLLDHYALDSVGWATPFLLVPEVTNVDDHTRDQLVAAKEKDVVLSHSSPLGVPFYALKGTSKHVEQRSLVEGGRPGSSCPKEYLEFNTEFTERPICVASRQYQKLKLSELDGLGLTVAEYQQRFDRIVEKSCLCAGLGAGALVVHGLERKQQGGDGVLICPGPNIAYFSEIVSLKTMVDHIYGRTNLIRRTDRPHVFMKELRLYVDYLKGEIRESVKPLDEKQRKFFETFRDNLNAGIEYYRALRSRTDERWTGMWKDLQDELLAFQNELEDIFAREFATVAAVRQ
ncbi:MAG: hypothetical protein WEB33_01015 [Bacteroidota bacterium]